MKPADLLTLWSSFGAGLAVSICAHSAGQALVLNRGVEAPPQAYASGPTQTGRTSLLEYADARAVAYICALGMGEPPQRGGSWWGCYRPDLDAVIAPARGAWAEGERQRILQHEWAHARGWRHNPDGRGTSLASLPPPRTQVRTASNEVTEVATSDRANRRADAAR